MIAADLTGDVAAESPWVRLQVAARKLADRLDARPVRERALVLATGLVALYAIASAFLLDPAEAERTRLRQEAAALSQEIQGYEETVRLALEAHGADPDAAIRERLGEIDQRLAPLDARIEARTVALIAPSEMVRALEAMLAERIDLELVGVRNLEPQPALPDVASGEAVAGIYRHEFVIDVRGSYLSVLAYLESLEALPWKLDFEGFEYRSEDAPLGAATIRATTLSAREGWVGV